MKLIDPIRLRRDRPGAPELAGAHLFFRLGVRPGQGNDRGIAECGKVRRVIPGEKI